MIEPIPEASISSESASSAPSTTSGTNGQAQSESDSSFSLARAETRAVNRSKLLVLAVIALAAGALGAMIYVLVDNEETYNFETEFLNFAHEIADLAAFEAKNIFASIDDLSTTITSFALATGAVWPNVTVPHFEIRGAKNNKLSQALQVTLVPLVTVEGRTSWEAYAQAQQRWLQESLDFQDQTIVNGRSLQEDVLTSMPVSLWRFDEHGGMKLQDGPGVDFGPGSFAPVWQQAPAPSDPSILMYDLLSNEVFNRIYHGMWETRLPVLSEVTQLDFLYGAAVEDDKEHPHSFLLSPIYPDFQFGLRDRDDLVGFLVAVLPWDSYFSDLLVEGINGVVIVLHDTCGEHFTYKINGPEAVFLGKGDLHDPRYDALEFDTEFAPFLKHNFSDTHEHCEYDLLIFPSASLEAEYRTNKPGLYTAVVVLVFFFTAMVFVGYDWLVQRRQNKVMATAKRTNAIVSSLFPSNVRHQIMKEVEEKADKDAQELNKRGSIFAGLTGGNNKTKLKAFLDEGATKGTETAYDTKPIADLFPNVTVMFADIVGFTAWSSVREPSQVFTLLETLFAAFDEIASRRRVFKVETVGDCYVAVAGLPDPRKDHAVVMARFARDVLYKMNDLTKRLEVVLGPDTGDLSLRIGLHSGQVTAGVLRGDKSRFQLFGDTMNTASRIETTGERNRIHVSVETASLLMVAGKNHWVKERDDYVEAKGKGEIRTYWLELRPQSNASVRSGSSENSSRIDDVPMPISTKPQSVLEQNEAIRRVTTDKTRRLIDWNVDVLLRLLKQIEARRRASGQDQRIFNDPEDAFDGGASVLAEVKEIITLPRFNKNAAKAAVEDPDTITLNPAIKEQLHDYVSTVSSLYRDNPFHNFEHASHVTMSVVKLLSRIVAPDVDVADKEDRVAAALHDHTYGITSDPLTQFACIFSALIHDVDHTGVPNTQLVEENAPIATVYGNKSVAEQNSVDIAWGLLMAPEYAKLRGAIYEDEEEMQRFRQLVVNSLMATDIMDKDANAFRRARWDRAFKEGAEQGDSKLDSVNRKATIVIEHLIQASDVSHTMQHWHIYSKWNEKLFEEMYKAYKEGRSDKDPSQGWYEGEIGFFDFYVIPLAQKLKTCGVFGVASDEYLNYAMSNRREWEARGRERVEAMIAKGMDAYDE